MSERIEFFLTKSQNKKKLLRFGEKKVYDKMILINEK